MHVHVILRVHVIELQPGARKRFELRANFGFECAARAGVKEEAQAGDDEIA